MKDHLVNETKASQLLGCSVAKMQKDRRLSSPIPYYKVGRSVKYKLSDIEQYLEQQRFTSTSQYGGRND